MKRTFPAVTVNTMLHKTRSNAQNIVVMGFIVAAAIFCVLVLKSSVAPPSPSQHQASQEIVAALRQQIRGLMDMRVAYGELYCRLHGIGPTGGFCVHDTTDVGGNSAWDAPVCKELAQLFAGKRVLDLGCGLGHYGRCLTAAGTGIQWTGLDGSEGIQKATGEE